LLAMLLLSGVLLGQSAAPNDPDAVARLAQQVKDLQQQAAELRDQVKKLDAERANGSDAGSGPAGPVTPVIEAAPPAPAPAATDASAAQMGELSAAMHQLHSIHWLGFGEVNYKVLNQRQPEAETYGFVPGSSGSFYTGDFGLFLTSKLTNKTSVLAEIIFEEGDAQSFSVDLRRVFLKYDFNDHLKMSFGRYQTNIGYYNWAYRSAAWLQTTVDRPLVMEFATNGGLLPTQAIGVSITGAVPSRHLGLNYIAEYGSSDTIRLDVNGDGESTDENNGNQVNVGFFVRPDAVPGLQAGASYYHDKISNVVEIPSVRYGQSIINAYVVYDARGYELLSEGFLIRHNPLHFDGPTFNTPAFYSQISKKFHSIRPFFRYQYVNANPNDETYEDVSLRAGPSFGARYDANDCIALKAQLDHTLRRGEPDLNGLHLQIAVHF
jgi:hypothetical protein